MSDFKNIAALSWVAPPIQAPSRFEVREHGEQHSLLAWRDSVGHVIDVVPSLAQLQNPFSASISRYRIGQRLLTDCSSDAVLLERSVARISMDDRRDYAFHVFTEGGLDDLQGTSLNRSQAQPRASIVLLDMNQPVRMQRTACRVLTLFVPRAIVETALPNAEALHGRTFENVTPMTQLVVEHVAALVRELPGLRDEAAAKAFDASVCLLIAAFGKQAKLMGDARAAIRGAMFDKARRYIRENLHQANLSPDSLLQALQLPRPSLYRLFEHEGGLAAYIRNCRLREACDELVKFEHVPVAQIAFGLGFKSPSDFTRAFRRAYGMTPLDLRAIALQRFDAVAGMGEMGA